MWNPFRRKEQRASPEDPNIPLSGATLQLLWGDDYGQSAAGETVTIDTALGVPSIWAAVNFMSGTLAGLPVHVYRKTAEGRERSNGPLSTILHDVVNPGMSSFEWRKYCFDQVFTGGRAATFIERNGASKVMNLWPLDPSALTVKREKGEKVYEYRDGASRKITYKAAEIIDLPFMLKSNMLDCRSPILTNAEVIGLAIAVTKYGARFFQKGGVPPLALEGPITTKAGAKRAAQDIMDAIQGSREEGRNVLVMPPAHKLTPIGFDPQKGQLVEVQRFLVEQIARIYSLPPTFLQDLTHGTFSNTEQQDLHFVKHTLKRWVEQFEQEMNLKLFGRAMARQYIEMNVDGLLRGDFKSRMEGYASAIQNAIRTPNEVRDMENLPANPKGDELLIQGATVPLGSQPVEPTDGAPPSDEGNDDAT